MGRFSWHAYVFLTPVLALYAVFFVFPFLFSLYISFMDWDLIMDVKTFVGLANYTEVWESSVFWKSVRNTLVYMLISVPPSVGLGLLFAVLIEQTKRMRAVYRVVMFLPMVVSVAAASLVFSLMYSPHDGLFNILLAYIGVPSQAWLQDPSTALLSVALLGIWMSFGYNVILYITGLKQIDKEVLQAASMDGAGAWRTFWSMTFPLLAPVHMFVCIMTVLYSFQVFATVQIMTMGGPNNATNVWVFYIWQEAFRYSNIGVASAAATMLFVVVLLITVVSVTWLRKKADFAGEG